MIFFFCNPVSFPDLNSPRRRVVVVTQWFQTLDTSCQSGVSRFWKERIKGTSHTESKH